MQGSRGRHVGQDSEKHALSPSFLYKTLTPLFCKTWTQSYLTNHGLSPGFLNRAMDSVNILQIMDSVQVLQNVVNMHKLNSFHVFHGSRQRNLRKTIQQNPDFEKKFMKARLISIFVCCNSTICINRNVVAKPTTFVFSSLESPSLYCFLSEQ